jgi:hypothetical protein
MEGQREKRRRMRKTKRRNWKKTHQKRALMVIGTLMFCLRGGLEVHGEA